MLFFKCLKTKWFKAAIVPVLFLAPVVLVAQNRPGGGMGRSGQMEKIGVVSGKIIDSQNTQPLEYANVALFRMKDSSLVDGGITDDKGQFMIEKLPFGKFFVKIQFIGYPTKVIDSVFIRPDKPQIDLGTVKIQLSNAALSGVEIKGTKAGLEYNLDKKVINVDQTITSAGATAIDLMQTIPAINVDIDGNISLRGSTNVTILIDGRPSNLVSLDQLPASMIERVELITNPSARYDPDGTTGILNIVLKKQKKPGYNGMIMLNAGTGNKYNASANLNFRYHKFNFFTTYDYRRFAMTGEGKTSRTTTINNQATYFDQLSESKRNGNFHNFKLGADYFINPRNTLSVSGMLNFRKNKGEDISQNLTRNSGLDTTSLFYNSPIDNSNNSGFEGNLNYKRSFANKIQELTVDAYFSGSNGDSDNDLLIHRLIPDFVFPDSLQNTLTATKRNTSTAQIDYVHPLGTGRLETGYKLSWNKTDSDYKLFAFNQDVEEFQINSNISNQFIYDLVLNSAYGIYSNMINEKLTYQLGARVEHAIANANQVTQDTTVNNKYLNVFPSVHVKYELNTNQLFQLSYSRRVNRPGSQVLNPFVNYSDPLNLSYGNPYLEPEFSNSLELGSTSQIKKTTINSSLFYRNTENVIARIMTVDTTGISRSTYRNQDKSYSYGLELIVTQQFLRWWRVNGNFSYFRSRFEGQDISAETRETDSWTFKFNSMMQIPKICDVQVSFNYNSPVVFTPSIGGHRGQVGGSQGRMDEMYSADIGLKKDVLDGNGTITVRLSDVFKTQKYNMTSYGTNFISFSERSRDSRTLFIGFSYRFNDYKKQQRREDMNNMDDFE